MKALPTGIPDVLLLPERERMGLDFLCANDESSGGTCMMSLRRRGAAEEVCASSLGQEVYLTIGGGTDCTCTVGFNLDFGAGSRGLGFFDEGVGNGEDEAGSEAPFLCCARTVAREDCTAERARGCKSVSIRLKAQKGSEKKV
jgi:hypothetical protein